MNSTPMVWALARVLEHRFAIAFGTCLPLRFGAFPLRSFALHNRFT